MPFLGQARGTRIPYAGMETNPQNSAEIAQTIDNARQGRSWWQACCMGCGIFFVFGVIGVILLFRFMAGAPVEIRTDFPPQFPKDIAVFAPEKAASITYAPGRQKSRMLHFVTTPLRWIGDIAETTPGGGGETSKILESYGSEIAAMDSVTVYWRNLEAKPQEVMMYYGNGLRNQGFEVKAVPAEGSGIEFLASRPNATVHGTIHPKTDQTAIDDMVLTITYEARQAAAE